jgi:hypothetical protein
MILAPVGAGKTAITLTAMTELLAEGHVKRWLVLAPKRVCTDVWPVEQPKWAPDFEIAIATGTPAQRQAALVKALLITKKFKTISNEDRDLWSDGEVGDCLEAAIQ